MLCADEGSRKELATYEARNRRLAAALVDLKFDELLRRSSRGARGFGRAFLYLCLSLSIPTYTYLYPPIPISISFYLYLASIDRSGTVYLYLAGGKCFSGTGVAG